MSDTNHNSDTTTLSEQIQKLASDDEISMDAYRRALVLNGERPDSQAWKDFIQQCLLFAGIGFTISGILFFFAFNWVSMSRFVKFGLLEGSILLAVFFAFSRGLQRTSGKAALLTAAFLVGPLLGVYGQIYQTGADPYQLFLGWSLLILGWIVISDFAPAWFLLILLLNVTLPLMCMQVFAIRLEGNVFLLLMFALNTTFFALWELLAPKVPWLQTPVRWAQRTLFLALLAPISLATFNVIVKNRYFGDKQFGLLTLFCYLGGGSLALYLYQKKEHRDFFVLSMFLLTVIVNLTTWIGRIIKIRSFESFFVLGALVILQATVAVFWLRKVERT